MDHLTACIFNIQKYSIHDGPGIRTVIFFKGCPLQCLWCSNPESQSCSLQLVLDSSKCKPHLNCPESCPQKASMLPGNKTISNKNNTVKIFDYIKTCPEKALTLYGEYQSLDYVMKDIMKDKDFYEESQGGITLSGGEPLLQHEFAIALLKQLKEQGIHTACETTGYASPEVFQAFINHIDLLLFDIKHYDSQKHFDTTGVHNIKIIANLKTAINQGTEVIVRIPVIPTINDRLEDAYGFCKLLKEIGVTKVNLLPFHQFGQKKYSLLNKEYKLANVPRLHMEDLNEYKKIFIQHGLI